MPRLARIYLDSRIFTFNWMEPTGFSLSDFQRDTQGEMILAAEVRGRIVGFSSSWEPENFIHHLYLNPQDVGRGYGGRLLDGTVKILDKPVRLKAQVRNTKAMWFYRNRGWEELGRGITDRGEYIELVLR
jgi:GNAT superfamily N-acetyltransferase